jgi:cytoskeletal protein CcmA (bactofilin family)
MFGGKATKPQNRIDSLIGEATMVEGNVVFTGGLRIDGRVKGNVPRIRRPTEYPGAE